MVWCQVLLGTFLHTKLLRGRVFYDQLMYYQLLKNFAPSSSLEIKTPYGRLLFKNSAPSDSMEGGEFHAH
jgi:hypothetical protein